MVPRYTRSKKKVSFSNTDSSILGIPFEKFSFFPTSYPQTSQTFIPDFLRHELDIAPCGSLHCSE